jgi:4-hydroxybenzoate polyprenyltransferase
MTNLIREIVKDAQDIPGDREQGSHTLPITIGIKNTRLVIIGLSVLTIVVLGFFFLSFLKDRISLAYFVIALLLPFLFFIIKSAKAADAADFSWLSQIIKLIMLLGLLYAPLVHWLIRNFLTR